MLFQCDYLCSATTYDIIIAAIVRYIINTYSISMKQPDLYYFEAMKMTSQTLSKFTENTHLWLVFSMQNLTRLVRVRIGQGKSGNS